MPRVAKCRRRDLNFLPSSRQTRKSGVSDLRKDTAGSFFSTCGAVSKGPLASLSNAACVALIRPGSSAIGRELLATKAATISAANSIDCEASASDVMGEFLIPKATRRDRYE